MALGPHLRADTWPWRAAASAGAGEPLCAATYGQLWPIVEPFQQSPAAARDPAGPPRRPEVGPWAFGAACACARVAPADRGGGRNMIRLQAGRIRRGLKLKMPARSLRLELAVAANAKRLQLEAASEHQGLRFGPPIGPNWASRRARASIRGPLFAGPFGENWPICKQRHRQRQRAGESNQASGEAPHSCSAERALCLHPIEMRAQSLGTIAGPEVWAQN